ncbi:hypothetical protein AVEN_224358-1 [Araneus ventricosus]|uniref:Uncharacterized protein n=1 Tax=Araneus ventricosus TaxID=182803 RepID=A0A4Y2WIV5_ARAVE|nr:hypothetical protein AVEN_224358-1 [Araneus ventricosus]
MVENGRRTDHKQKEGGREEAIPELVSKKNDVFINSYDATQGGGKEGEQEIKLSTLKAVVLAILHLENPAESPIVLKYGNEGRKKYFPNYL